MHADRQRARAALVGLTTIWGSTFVVLQSALALVSPLVLISVRFALAAVTLLALRPAAAVPGWRAVRASLPLSLSMLAGFALQTTGLQTTTPARSAFITSLSVLMVPLVAYASDRLLPRPALLVAVLAAASGVYLLFRPVGLEWRKGDTLTLVAALAFAYYIVVLGRLSRQVDAAALVLAQSYTIALVALPLAPLIERPRFAASLPSLLALGYLGVICTALTFFLMTWAQARVEPVEAAVIYTLEPVIAAAFSVALGYEMLTTKMIVGGSLILAATLVSGLQAPRSST